MMLDLAERHHPAWERCRPAARKLLARNGCQVLGPKLAGADAAWVVARAGALAEGRP